MICIPQNVGLSYIVIEQKRTVFINDADPAKFMEFMNESDNILALKNIKSMVVVPMISHDNTVCGVF